MPDSTSIQHTGASILSTSQKVSDYLLSCRETRGFWKGRLSSSALSTATAVVALEMMGRKSSTSHPEIKSCIKGGKDWLAGNSNPDGGWGDTISSHSNISTTALCWAALRMTDSSDHLIQHAVDKAESWLASHAGGIDPDCIARAILERYGKDRTFSVPILTLCALSGRFGNDPSAWRYVLQLPFELAAFPGALFAAFRLPVVSYALPALIAIGQVVHCHRPTRNPLLRLLRNALIGKTLKKLISLQPGNGGFLEATPLTSFVTMSLAGCGRHDHPVAMKGLEFLLNSVRSDGAWPIDTDLATWVTTLSVNSLSLSRSENLRKSDRESITEWLLAQQYRKRHPYTLAAPGGWAWTPLPGGVPDADDTSGALLALKHLNSSNAKVLDAASAGVNWLREIQNSDGGIPTFCRGWGALPFDRSSPDITSHALRAWLAWQSSLRPDLRKKLKAAIPKALRYLNRIQRIDGAWQPLWFGNQHAPDDLNLTYGTSRVLLALCDVTRAPVDIPSDMMRKGAEWLVTAQNPDGSWSGASNLPPSIEETALALDAIACLAELDMEPDTESGLATQALRNALRGGVAWLTERVEQGEWTSPSPIGFYFAKLWYFEELYPVIFSAAALNRAERVLYRFYPK